MKYYIDYFYDTERGSIRNEDISSKNSKKNKKIKIIAPLTLLFQKFCQRLVKIFISTTNKPNLCDRVN